MKTSFPGVKRGTGGSGYKLHEYPYCNQNNRLWMCGYRYWAEQGRPTTALECGMKTTRPNQRQRSGTGSRGVGEEAAGDGDEGAPYRNCWMVYAKRDWGDGVIIMWGFKGQSGTTCMMVTTTSKTLMDIMNRYMVGHYILS